MANTDNECKTLSLGDREFPDFERLFNLQKKIQEDTYHYRFNEMSISELSKFWFMNKHALTDELSEMFDALGGINDGIGNAGWKPWKKDHSLAEGQNMDSLSENDRKELLFEMADVLIFFMNFPISAGFSGTEIANAVSTKIEENVRRQATGY